MPIEAEGFDQKSGKNDQIARPVLRVSNVLFTVSAILLDVNKISVGNDLTTAKLTRIRTLAMFLDSVNFPRIQTYKVTVVQSGGNNVFAIDGVTNPTLILEKQGRYTFDQTDISNAGHPIAFRQTNDAAYTSGVTSTGTPGTASANTLFVVPSNAPAALKYYCTVHGNNMGNNITVNNAYVNPTANTNATSRKEIYEVDRKSVENREVVEFELSAISDRPNYKIPKRQVLPRQFPGVGAFHE